VFYFFVVFQQKHRLFERKYLPFARYDTTWLVFLLLCIFTTQTEKMLLMTGDKCVAELGIYDISVWPFALSLEF
jgi:hypothetical protein